MLLHAGALLQGITEAERYYLLRLRAGMSQARLARTIGRSRRWVVLMEHGRVPLADLRRYWRGRR